MANGHTNPAAGAKLVGSQFDGRFAQQLFLTTDNLGSAQCTCVYKQYALK